jgi:protein gp37
MSKTNIEWTAVRAPDGTMVPGYTFNPWWGCLEVSPACANCYAKTLAARWGFDVWGKETPFRFFGDKHWNEPRKWNERARKLGLRIRVFCGSMCDWLQDRPELVEPRARLLALIDGTPALDWLMLTKRPENLDTLTPWRDRGGAPANVMLGATVEDQRRADERIPVLLAFPSLRPAEMGQRFLSCEPLLGPVDLERVRIPDAPSPPFHGHALRAYRGFRERIDWVICGSESGHPSKVRETRDEWVASLRDQCAAAGVPFFLKQFQDTSKPAGRVVSLPVFQGQQHLGQPGGVAA